MGKLLWCLSVVSVFVLFLAGCGHTQKMYGEEELVEELKSRPDWVTDPLKADKEKYYAVGVSEYLLLQNMALAAGETDAQRVMSSNVGSEFSALLRTVIVQQKLAISPEEMAQLVEYATGTKVKKMRIPSNREDFYLARFKRYEGNEVKYYWGSWVLLSATNADIQQAKRDLKNGAANKAYEMNLSEAKRLKGELDKIME